MRVHHIQSPRTVLRKPPKKILSRLTLRAVFWLRKTLRLLLLLTLEYAGDGKVVRANKRHRCSGGDDLWGCRRG